VSGRIIAYDIGTTGCKTCLYRFDGRLELEDSAMARYELRHVGGGGVEQDPEDWWKAMGETTREILGRRPSAASEVRGLSFCAQMQGLVLVDERLEPVRPAMSYLDRRAAGEQAQVLGRGLKIEGMNAAKLLTGLAVNGAVAASAKDPVWKYRWVRTHEPGNFARVRAWLDVKEYLIARATGKCVMTGDSAFATFLTGEKAGLPRWDPRLARMYGVDPSHLPRIIGATQEAGRLGPEAAAGLGLPEGILVFGGGGDASMIAVGSGATGLLDCHVYTGTSGWVSCSVDRRKTDVSGRIASIVGAQPGRYNYFAEQETAGKCLEWVRDHLAKDEIDLYLGKHSVVDLPESRYRSLYDFLIEAIRQVPPGSGGALFAPWLHGNRSPFEDPNARGIFFNLGLETGKRAMIRAVVEGIIFHQRWLLETIEKNFRVNDGLRFCGGGALSPDIARIMADIMGRRILTVAEPQNCGAAGAAYSTAIGLGWLPGFDAVRSLVPIQGEFSPDPANSAAYGRNYLAFKRLYGRNRGLFAALNGTKKGASA
jgi:xylulokinase